MPKLYQMLWYFGSNADGVVPPRYIATVTMPKTADNAASAQIARYGERVLPCNSPKCEGTSSSRPIAYVTRAPVLRQDNVVPINARNTVNACTSMNARPAA